MRYRSIALPTHNPREQTVSISSLKQALQRTQVQIQYNATCRTAALGVSERGILFTQPIAR